MKEWVKTIVIRRMGHIVTLVRGDYELARKWYGAKGKYYHGAYLIPITKEYLDSLPNNSKSTRTINIQIGNSANKGNNHLEALAKLKHFKDEDIKIYVPLSYSGNEGYKKSVIEEGKKVFGDKFVPMTEFLPPDEYASYLNNIDIAIFNNNRQQALGNIYALLYLNKKVYIRSDTSMWSHFKEQFAIDMNDVLTIENVDFEDFASLNRSETKSKIEKVFLVEYYIHIWEPIFEEKSKQ